MNANIKNLETMYKETKNPLYVWQAVTMIEPSQPYPSWIRQYIDDVALNIVRLALEVPPDGTEFLAGARWDESDKAVALDNSEKTAKLPAALGLGGQGKKPFEEFTKNEKRASFTAWYDDMRKKGVKAESLKQQAMDHFGVSRSTVAEWIATSQRLWDLQRRDMSGNLG